MRVAPYALPLRAPFRTARGELRERRGFLVRVEAHGRTGLGEAAPLAGWTEDEAACRAALDEAAGALRGASDPGRLLPRLDAACPALAGAPAARHAVSLALLDLGAQQAGEPLHAHLARTLLPGAEPAARVPVNATVGAGTPEDAARQAREAVQAGYETVKVKLPGQPAADLAMARAVREAAPRAALRLDPNAAWPGRAAEERLAQLAPLEPAYVEQPVEGVEALRALRALRIVPLAADEAARAVPDALRVLDREAADVLVVKPMSLGGPDRALRVIEAARALGAPCVVTSLLDGAVARAGALHVAALLPGPIPACGLGTGGLLARDVGTGPAVERGRIRVPQAPGLGVRLG